MKTLPSKEKLKQIRADIEEALKSVKEKHGLEEMKIGNITYDESGFRAPLEARFEGGETKDIKALRLNAPFIGFKPEIANAEIMFSGKKYQVVGLKRTKLHLKNLSDQKTYTANIEQVLSQLKMQNSPLLVEV